MEPGAPVPVERTKVSPYTDEVGELLAVQCRISRQLEPDIVAQRTADEALRLTSAEMSVIYLSTQDDILVTAISGSVGKNLLNQRLPRDGSLAGMVIRTGQPLLVQDLQKGTVPFSPLVEKFSTRSLLILPLNTPAGAVGAVLVASRFPGHFDKDDLRILGLLLPSAVVALLNAQRFVNARAQAALEERQRITRRLQSIAAQTLFSASLIADILPRLVEIDPQEGRSRMQELREITRKALSEMRSLIVEDR
jgi:GAF domain-containing protein